MRNKMNKLVDELNDMYVTENPVNLTGDDFGYKYFLCYTNTHKIEYRSKSLRDMVEYLEEISEDSEW